MHILDVEVNFPSRVHDNMQIFLVEYVSDKLGNIQRVMHGEH